MAPKTKLHYCLIVYRSGQSTIFPLLKDEIHFGYAPPQADDLVLYDGALADVQGVIQYREPSEESKLQEPTHTNFWLSALSKGVEFGDEPLPASSGVQVYLSVGNQIRVGAKYLLIVSEYQRGEESNAVQSQQIAVRAGQPRSAYYTNTYPPHLDTQSRQLLPLLPAIFQPSESFWPNEAILNGSQNQPRNFLDGFLALIESTYLPLRWTIDNFDLFLHPESAPPDFLPFLAQWYGLPIGEPEIPNIPIEKQRQIVKSMSGLIACKGTVHGLVNLLTLYTGKGVEIIDYTIKEVGTGLQGETTLNTPNHFIVNFKEMPDGWNDEQIKKLIAFFQPAHTTLQSIDYGPKKS